MKVCIFWGNEKKAQLFIYLFVSQSSKSQNLEHLGSIQTLHWNASQEIQTQVASFVLDSISPHFNLIDTSVKFSRCILCVCKAVVWTSVHRRVLCFYISSKFTNLSIH